MLGVCVCVRVLLTHEYTGMYVCVCACGPGNYVALFIDFKLTFSGQGTLRIHLSLPHWGRSRTHACPAFYVCAEDETQVLMFPELALYLLSHLSRLSNKRKNNHKAELTL